MIRIVIAEDEEWVLGTIGALLSLEEDMEIVGKSRDREHALELIHYKKPDILILDIEHLLRDGPLDVPECRLLVLATFPRDGYLERVQDAGADGYLLKDSPSEELTSSIRRMMMGKQVFSSKLVEKKEPALYEIPHAPGPVKKNYFTMIMDKMKHPTG